MPIDVLRKTSTNYRQPDRIHFGKAAECSSRAKEVMLTFYPKSYADTSENRNMRHMPAEIEALGQHLKTAFWPALHPASRAADYDLCVAMIYRGDSVVGDHTDSRPTRRGQPISQVADTDVMVHSHGATMELWTREITSPLYAKDKRGRSIVKVSKTQEHACDLVGSGGFMLSKETDWTMKHSVWPREGASPEEERIAFVFRALNTTNKFKVKWPHRGVVSSDEAERVGARKAKRAKKEALLAAPPAHGRALRARAASAGPKRTIRKRAARSSKKS